VFGEGEHYGYYSNDLLLPGVSSNARNGWSVLDIFEAGLDPKRLSERGGTSIREKGDVIPFTSEETSEIEAKLRGLGYLDEDWNAGYDQTPHKTLYHLWMGGVLNKFIGFFLLPIYTRLLTLRLRILSLLSVTSSLATIVAQLGLGTAIFPRDHLRRIGRTFCGEHHALLPPRGIALFFGVLIASPQRYPP